MLELLDEKFEGKLHVSKREADAVLGQAPKERFLPEAPTGMALPEFVRSVSHSKGRVHRPRDAKLTFCSWPWASAMAMAQAKALSTLEGGSLAKCGICDRAHAARGS